MPNDTPLTIWRDRLCKVEDGLYHISRRGNHDDWDYAQSDPDAAMAGHMGTQTVGHIEKVDEETLRITSGEGKFLMTGKDTRDFTVRPEKGYGCPKCGSPMEDCGDQVWACRESHDLGGSPVYRSESDLLNPMPPKAKTPTPEQRLADIESFLRYQCGYAWLPKAKTPTPEQRLADIESFLRYQCGYAWLPGASGHKE